ncbi:hypothetical protein ONS95_014484 [Cadophora gregata]|uniref:uncharacterized protein n=1 Tax=Cadophora gregata TaxID=51156 RepID=UPI0026DC5FA8|nr:uncharacterized protein ONS95_014484 [Cadophora gregata]KAK0112749.1 hypothetical protein ONS95_014484 [Cadophora gregata]
MSSIVDASDPSYLKLEKILAGQRSAVKNALRRKGERPQNLPARSQCINEFEMASLSNQMRNMQAGHLMMTTVLGYPYPPATASVDNLRKLMIKDLTLETNHRGHYLLLRFVCTAMRMSAVMNIVEDEAGSVIPFALDMQEPETVRRADSIFRENGVIIVKETYFKIGTNGQYAIRVDHPTDIVWLSENDHRVPTKWRVRPDDMPNAAEHWKKKGNDAVGKAKYYDAIDMGALLSSPSVEERDIIYRNRALAYLQTESLDGALEDIACVSDPQEKGLYLKGLALYGLGRFNDAMEVFQAVVDSYPSSGSGKEELNRCRLRMAEHESGIYDFKAMYKATKLRPPRVDAATYKGPVEVRKSEGRGRGLYTTRAVKAGEIHYGGFHTDNVCKLSAFCLYS